MTYRILITLAISFLAFSCVPEKGSEDFLAPEIESATVVVDGTSVNFNCSVSDARFESCGFVYGVPGVETKTVICQLSSDAFSSRVDRLVPGTTYEWYAFVRAGDNEIRSETGTFTVPEPVEGVEDVYIPDPYFRRYLLDNYDSDSNGFLSEEECLIIRKIDIVTDKISSLHGIENFKNLDSLICRGSDVNEYDDVGHPGMLDSLDVSCNRKLRYLACDKNMLRSLDISDNPFLEEVLCSYNLLESIDLTAVPRLKFLRMWVNKVSSLDFSCTPLLESLECGSNPITTVDVSRCPRLGVLNVGDLRIKELDLSGNPMLGWLGTYGTDISVIDLSHNTRLEYLNCQNSPIKELNLSSCTNLHELKCWDCQLEELNVSMLPKLVTLKCSPMSGTSGDNLLKKLYVSEDQRIPGVTVDRSSNSIPEETEIVTVKAGTVIIPDQAFKAWLLGRYDNDRDGEISMSEAEEINEIDVWSDELNITSLKGIEFMPNLEILRCRGNWIGTTVLARDNYYLSKHYHWNECVGPIGTLKYIDVSHNPQLKVLDIGNNSAIGETGSGTIDLSNNPLLEELQLPMCYIKYPDVGACPLLRDVNFSHGRGDIPDFSKLSHLRSLDISHDQRGRLHPVDVSGSPDLEELNLDAAASSLSDLKYNPKLKVLKVSWCVDVIPDLSAVPLLEEYERISCDLHSLDLSGLRNLKSLTISGNPLGRLDLSYTGNLERLVCNSCGLTELDVKGVKNLEYLECCFNSIVSIDFKSCPNLAEIYVSDNPLKSIDLTSNKKLLKLFCANTGLSGLNVSGNPLLWDLRCEHNHLTILDVSSNPKLWGLYCSDNSITGLNLLKNPVIQELDCSYNKLESLNVSACPLLRWLVCRNNRIRTLDLSNNSHFEGPNGDDITGLFCSPMNDGNGNNLLEIIYVPKGRAISGVTVNRSADHVPTSAKIETY